MLQRILVCVIVVVITAAFLLPHWHSDWNQGCQLCHVQNLPGVSSPIPFGPTLPIATERYWPADRPAAEVDIFPVKKSSRAPPSAASFTV